jgi:hypothetical protein
MTKTSILNIAKTNRVWSRSQRVDALLSIVALSQIFLGALQGTMLALGLPEELCGLYRVYLSAITIIIAAPFIVKRKPLLVLVTYSVAIVIYYIHSAFFPKTIEYWHLEAFRFTFPISIPTILCVLAIKEKVILLYFLKIIAYLTGVLCLIYGLRVFFGIYDLGFSYNQGFGYMLLFPIIVLFYQRTWYSLLFASILLLLLLLYGARGPLLAIVVYAAYVLVSQKKYVLLFTIIIILLIGIPILTSTLASYGLSSRTLELYMSGELDADNGRNVITEQIKKGIEENPYGWGLFGDRVITHGANNAHNFVREILAEFGVYLGPLALLIFFIQVVRRFFKTKGGERDMYALFFCACFIPTMVSGSYLTSTNFALFIGVMFLLTRKPFKNKSVVKQNN